MIRKLHPTLKACKCGFIGVRSSLYKHFDNELTEWKLSGDQKSFYIHHGEVPLNENDPRASLEHSLAASLTREQKLELL